jgi:hypothetical protein
MWAMSMLGNAKSSSHRKTHQVESDGTGRKFMHLTRGGLRFEKTGEVSRGHSSKESRRKAEGAKDRRTTREQSTNGLECIEREEYRKGMGVTITVATFACGSNRFGWIPEYVRTVVLESSTERKEVAEDAQ